MKNIKNKLTIIFFGFFLQANLYAEPSSNTIEFSKTLCKRNEFLIENNLKTIAYESESGFLDNSAPRETIRRLKIVAANNEITNLLLHMRELKCPAIEWSISSSPFRYDALKCVSAKGDTEVSEKCNMKKWVRKPED